MAAWESVEVIGLDCTKLTSYGASLTNHGDYHDISYYSNYNPTYASVIEKMGGNYFYYHDRNTCEAGETSVYVEVYNDGTWSVTNMSTTPYYDHTDSRGRKYYSSRYGVELFYQGSSIGRLSASMSARYDAGVTPDHVKFIDKVSFGFLIDRTRSLGQLLFEVHEDTDDDYTWDQSTQGGIDNRHYNIFIGNMLNLQAVNYITGNNKTYNLSKINSGYINGGDPVSGGAAASVTLINSSRLDILTS